MILTNPLGQISLNTQTIDLYDNMSTRNYTDIDHLLLNIDTGLRTLFGSRHNTGRPNPADLLEQDQAPTKDAEMPNHDRDLAGRLMRINHAGEVAAQGLYQGQALTAALPEVRQQMERAAAEENDHLDWCRRRTEEMGTHTSRLDPIWYVGSVLIGALAGKAGDKWSLGFVAETDTTVAQEIRMNDGELEDARWFTRKELRSGFPKLPFSISIARRLVESWLGAKTSE